MPVGNTGHHPQPVPQPGSRSPALSPALSPTLSPSLALSLSPVTERVLGREWALFTDWCVSWELSSLPAEAGTVARFLDAVPGAVSTRAVRVRAIRHHHQAAGHRLEMPGLTRPPDTLWREDDGLLGVEQAIGQLPRFRFPAGLRGRRDGFILIAAGVAGLTRNQIHHLTPKDITLTGNSHSNREGVRVGGTLVGAGEDPRWCLRCGVTRWLRVLGPAWVGDRGQVRDLLDVTRADPDEHDCGVPVAGPWRQADQVVVGLDTHGWVRPGVGLSTRSISVLVGPHRVPTGFTEPAAVTPGTGGRFATVTQDELYTAQDDLDQKVAHALLTTQQLLSEAETLDGILGHHTDG